MASLKSIKGISDKREADLNEQGIFTIEEFLAADSLTKTLKTVQTNARKTYKPKAVVKDDDHGFIIKDHSWVGLKVLALYKKSGAHVGTVGPIIIRRCRLEVAVIFEFTDGRTNVLPMSPAGIVALQIAYKTNEIVEESSDDDEVRGRKHIPLSPDPEPRFLEISISGIPINLHAEISATVNEVNQILRETF